MNKNQRFLLLLHTPLPNKWKTRASDQTRIHTISQDSIPSFHNRSKRPVLSCFRRNRNRSGIIPLLQTQGFYSLQLNTTSCAGGLLKKRPTILRLLNPSTEIFPVFWSTPTTSLVGEGCEDTGNGEFPVPENCWLSSDSSMGVKGESGESGLEEMLEERFWRIVSRFWAGKGYVTRGSSVNHRLHEMATRINQCPKHEHRTRNSTKDHNLA